MDIFAIRLIILAISIVWIAVIVTLAHEIELEVSCVDHVPIWVCKLGNIAGLFSSYLWSVCLIPQIWVNYSRRSTEGLSLRWASMNVMASLVNLNFVLRISLPLYVTISAVYMPILEMIVLAQFSMFGHTTGVKRTAFVFFVALSAVIVAAAVRWQFWGRFVDDSEWVAVVLWSLESFPQLWLNEYRQSTEGQSSSTVTVAFLGKTADFASMVCLNLPYQFRAMTYFSTCSAYINVGQFLYFRGQSMAAWSIAGAIIAYSVVMFAKLGLYWTIVLCCSFVLVLVGGYKLDSLIFQTRIDKKAGQIITLYEYDAADSDRISLLPADPSC